MELLLERMPSTIIRIVGKKKTYQQYIKFLFFDNQVFIKICTQNVHILRYVIYLHHSIE